MYNPFQLIANDGKCDNLLINDGLLNKRINKIIRSRAREKTIHLNYSAWKIERQMIADHIDVQKDINLIIAEYVGSSHGKAINVLRKRQNEIFSSEKSSDHICSDTKLLIVRLAGIIHQFGYKHVMGPFSDANDVSMDILMAIDDLFQYVVENYHVLSDVEKTNKLYHITLLAWPDHTDCIDNEFAE